MAVELSVDSARKLVDTILNVLNEAEQGGWVDENEGPEVHMPPVKSSGTL